MRHEIRTRTSSAKTILNYSLMQYFIGGEALPYLHSRIDSREKTKRR
jgi:hypothetical protein